MIQEATGLAIDPASVKTLDGCGDMSCLRAQVLPEGASQSKAAGLDLLEVRWVLSKQALHMLLPSYY